MPPTWDVLLIGGASGVGKSRLGDQLAQHYGVALTEVDDLHLVLETMTTSEHYPDLHYWANKPASQVMRLEDIIALHLRVARLLIPAVNAVINSHLESQRPVILEGDYLLPELLAPENLTHLQAPERIKAIFLYETEQAQIMQNYLQREPDAGAQEGRAKVSWRLGQWLLSACKRLGLPALEARPWESLVRRCTEAITPV